MKRKTHKSVIVFTFLFVCTVLINISLQAQQNLQGNWIIKTAEIDDYNSGQTLLSKQVFTYGITSGMQNNEWIIMEMMLSDTYWSIVFTNEGMKGESYRIQPANINFFDQDQELFSFVYTFQGDDTIVVEYEISTTINGNPVTRRVKETLIKGV